MYRSVDVAGGESFVSYAVHSVVKMLGSRDDTHWTVWHRYSDFELFDATLRRRVSESLDSLLVLLPTLPAKPWVPVGQFGRDWLESRARKLHRYMAALSKLGELQKAPQYLDPLLRFLSEGDLHQPRAACASSGSAAPGNWALFERGMYGVNAALGAVLDRREVPTPLQDYDYVRDMFQKQGLPPVKARRRAAPVNASHSRS